MSADGAEAGAMPDGITKHHCAPRPTDRLGGLAAITLLAALVAAGFSGLVGGAPHPVSQTETASVRLRIEYPEVLRSGEFFEGRIEITPLRDVADLTLAVSPSLWREHTVNSSVPAAEEETFKDGAYRFSYGPVEAGEPFFVKIAFQLNPPLIGGTEGAIAVLDGETELASLPMSLRVMP